MKKTSLAYCHQFKMNVAKENCTPKGCHRFTAVRNNCKCIHFKEWEK